MTPLDSVTNQKVKKIVLHFNKFVEINDLQKNLDLSPQLDIPPTVVANGKRVEIKIVDSLLKPNTTYRISLGNAITDNRERTPYGNFKYTFSTGSYFDSLQLQGNVLDVVSGKPDTGVIVVLYAEPFKDSMLLTKKPMYVTRTDGAGKFKFGGLPATSFKIYAIADADNNKMYGVENEKIGFWKAAVQPKAAADSSLITLKMFQQERIIPKLPDTIPKPVNKYIGKVISTDKNAVKYMVQADSSNLDKETFALNKPLNILLNAPVAKIDSAKIYLSYLNTGGIETEARRTLSTDSTSIKVHNSWQPETVYTLRLIKGWAVDTAGKELPPAKVSFKTKRKEDYAQMNIHIPAAYLSDKYILSIYKEQDSIYLKPVTDSIVSLSLLEPGSYTLKIIEDQNKNGKWDAGNVFTQLQPEAIFPHHIEVILKPGWENDIDFKYEPDAFAPDRNRPGAIPARH
ncbi:hypothetical protein DBR32_13325 [Taibaiella sp. KBW10]|nr:hypothetical protein DBR32_13325 [Taibaiella sp. KBW10]